MYAKPNYMRLGGNEEWPKGVDRPILGSLIVDNKQRIWAVTAIGWDLDGMWSMTITEQATGKEHDISFVDTVIVITKRMMAVFGHIDNY